jgi:uncharacterized membrane-anchored protein
MIPTMLALGLVLGWWWRTALVAAAVVWPALLVISGAVPLSADGLPALLGGALLAVANAAVGVAVVQGLKWLIHRLARRAHGQAHPRPTA